MGLMWFDGFGLVDLIGGFGLVDVVSWWIWFG